VPWQRMIILSFSARDAVELLDLEEASVSMAWEKAKQRAWAMNATHEGRGLASRFR